MSSEELQEGFESDSSSHSHKEEHTCSQCEEKLKNAKVMTCLHVFCQTCVEKMVVQKDLGREKVSVIECPICKQETKVPSEGVEALTTEYVVVDLVEMSAIEDMQIICTSCKAKEKAVARCSDCANFLCPNCVTAHQFMRCFENHKVVSFEDMKSGEGVAIHKPIFCSTHPSENLKYFCKTCEVPICNDCMVGEHKPPEHQHERIVDVEGQQKDELKALIRESKAKIEYCDQITTSLQNGLMELQMQRDNAKGMIQETFQSYKAILEKRKDELLEELESYHSSQELLIMDLCHNVEKTVDKIEDGSKFTEHILKNGSGLQILLLKKLVATQLMSLINNTPKPDISVNIEFHTDAEMFEAAIETCFGNISKEEPKHERPLSSLHSSFENEGFSLPHGVLSPDARILPHCTGTDYLPPVNLQGNHPDVPPYRGILGGIPTSLPMAITGGTQAMHETVSLSRNSQSPAMSDSGISVDAGSTNSSSSVPLVNIAALAKIGAVGFNSQGQVTLDGRVMPGLNMNNISGLQSNSSSSRGPTPISESGMMNTPTPRSQTPNLETLAGLLNQNTTGGLNFSMGSIGSLPSMNLNTNISNMNGMGSGNMTPTFSSSGILGGGLGSTGSGFNTPGSSTSSIPPVRRSKMSAMQIRCKFGQLGPGKGQFNSPHGFCLGIEEDITVADTNNHRIQVFEKTGEFKYQFGIPGREEGQLWYPRKVAVMRNSGKYVVCDRGNERSRMQIFTRNGHFIKKIAIRYIDIVAGLAITQQGHIVAVDSVSPTVFVIAETGELVKWFDCSDYMREPSDIAINGKEYFVCDFKGHCVVVFSEEGHFLRRIGCENITNYPNGIDISDAGDVLVGDSHGNRFHVAVFQRDGSLIGEFECPYVKVSRCCGLKITSEGYVVTLAKNNHHVLVLNTLYIT
ncbi:hypothetical protein ACJMK2_032652 [Sinanodonta woodiana]|uniref:Brain tumor protein n=1 Tax=Sinanodonta woodiana TaxID=1069815 RepID=A0ABD3X2E3_SINWO